MYNITVESDLFKGKSLVQQHQMVTDSISDELKNIHGYNLKTKVPEDKQEEDKKEENKKEEDKKETEEAPTAWSTFILCVNNPINHFPKIKSRQIDSLMIEKSSKISKLFEQFNRLVFFE